MKERLACDTASTDDDDDDAGSYRCSASACV